MKPTPLLPLNDVREVSLFFVISVLCFLTALCVLVGKASYVLTNNWAFNVQHGYTIIINDPEANLEQIQQTLSSEAGILTVEIVDKTEIQALLKSEFETAPLPEGLALPRLIDIQTTAQSDWDESNLLELVTSIAPDATIIRHADWLEEVKKYLLVARALAITGIGLLLASTIMIVSFATHAALDSRRNIISVLHRFGAQDRFIAKIFQGRFGALGLRSGICGALTALALVAGLGWFLVSAPAFQDLVPEYNLDRWDMLILCFIPFMVGFVARVSARITVLSALKKMF